MKIDSPKVNVDHNPGVESSEKPQNHNVTVVSQTDVVQNEKEGAQAQVEIPTSETKHPAAESSIPQEVISCDLKMEKYCDLHERVFQLPSLTFWILPLLSSFSSFNHSLFP